VLWEGMGNEGMGYFTNLRQFYESKTLSGLKESVLLLFTG
jgi:hypothetical protein